MRTLVMKTMVTVLRLGPASHEFAFLRDDPPSRLAAIFKWSIVPSLKMVSYRRHARRFIPIFP